MDKLSLTKIEYHNLNARQQEQYLFQKVSAVLSDYGYATMKLADDWQGADFIAQHCDGGGFLKIQLKGRFTIDKKYLGKELYIAFPLKTSSSGWCVFPHDEIVNALEELGIYTQTTSWKKYGFYCTSSLGNAKVLNLLNAFQL